MHSTDEITAHFGGLTIGTTDCVPFRPANSTRWQHLQLSPLPRFLFRVSTPKSDGSTDESWAKSRDAVNGLPCAAEDIFQSDDPSTVYKLTAHLWNYPNSRHDNMVSWTSSLLFAIQYIFYRHRKPEDSSTLDEIRLYVVDTAKFEKATFVRDMDLIRAFQLATCIWRDSNACGLMGKCESVSAQAMLDSGLASLRPEFGSWDEGENEWAKAVLRIRQQMSYEEQQQLNVIPEQAELALAVSQTFGPVWRLQIAIHLLALLPGQLKVDDVVRLLMSRRRFEEFEFHGCHSTSIVPYKEMPEVVRAKQIMQIVCSVRNRTHMKEYICEADSSIRRATMCALDRQDGIASLSDSDRSHLLDRMHQVAFMIGALEEIVLAGPQLKSKAS